VIHLDASFNQKLFDVAVGEAVAEIPTHSQLDHLGRKPIASER
jgi:hypothetical protein